MSDARGEPTLAAANIGEDHDPIHGLFTAARIYAVDQEAGTPVSANAATIMLGKLALVRDEVDRVELRLTEAALDAGGSWEDIATATERGSRQGAQRRYRRLGGTRTWPTRRPETPDYAPVSHPGTAIPHGWGSWSVSWPDYDPVDITPPELRPEALRQDGAPDWAEPATSPAEVPDWDQRQATALVPYAFDEHSWPLHPHGRTGRTGRNLPRWGENAAADPIVVAGTGPARHVLLIQRDDIGVWAIPGGMVDPGETAPATLIRELREDTGVDLTSHTPTILSRQVVADWRNTDHAWVASTAALFQLPDQVTTTAGDDAAAAQWFPAPDLPSLDVAMQHAAGALYDAHRELLAHALDEADREQG